MTKNDKEAPSPHEEAERLREHFKELLSPYMNRLFDELYVRIAYRRYWLSGNPAGHKEHIEEFADVATRLIDIFKKPLVQLVGEPFYLDVMAHMPDLREAMESGCSLPYAELLTAVALTWGLDVSLLEVTGNPDLDVDTMEGWRDAFKADPQKVAEAYGNYVPSLTAVMGAPFLADLENEMFGLGRGIWASFDTDTDEQHVATARKRTQYLAAHAND
jgi:hypothetical protein